MFDLDFWLEKLREEAVGTPRACTNLPEWSLDELEQKCFFLYQTLVRCSVHFFDFFFVDFLVIFNDVD